MAKCFFFFNKNTKLVGIQNFKLKIGRENLIDFSVLSEIFDGREIINRKTTEEETKCQGFQENLMNI